ncbi:transaldolase family protein [Peribacillus simplex]|uniref:transaldolase family protein n=1 Tax=Peribacillus simplex TaxID=1478 RepID=UPI001E4A246D|nr:transaldolase family protein [Peribacillus simplex]
MYLDTANIEEIKEAFSLGILKGVTTNPSILLKEGKSRAKVVKEILENSEGTVFVQAIGESYDDIYRDCQEIMNLDSNRVALKIPACFNGIKVIKQSKTDNPNTIILATAIFSVEQALLCALAGSDFVAPYVNRMENNNINPYEVITKIRKIFDDRNLSTKILAASFKNTNQLVDILFAGAHTATISCDVLVNMIDKQLAEASIKIFNKDWEKLQNQI